MQVSIVALFGADGGFLLVTISLFSLSVKLFLFLCNGYAGSSLLLMGFL